MRLFGVIERYQKTGGLHKMSNPLIETQTGTTEVKVGERTGTFKDIYPS